MFSNLFHPLHGRYWVLAVLSSFALAGILIAVLQSLPNSLRRPIIRIATFLGGLFYAVEFFWPTHPMPSSANPARIGNFLTPFVSPAGNMLSVIAAWTVGLGTINLCQIHGKRLLHAKDGRLNSLVFFISMTAMLILTVLQQAHPNLINQNLHRLLFLGMYQALDSTMFSLVAFFLVSAAYRAFRVRTGEATLLMVTAMVVMLGQIAIGQQMTIHLPVSGFWHNFRVEIVRDWIMTKANTPAVRAIAFGLGIGNLAVALRVWLGLERGAFFDS